MILERSEINVVLAAAEVTTWMLPTSTTGPVLPTEIA